MLTEHTPGWTPPSLKGVRTVAQVHCHQHAVLDDWSADGKLLNDAGADRERLDSGCCGLARNFGFEAGHLDVSVACAEQVLLPALREADDDTVVLADGFSCRTQIHQLDSGGREAIHLAEMLQQALRANGTTPRGPDLAVGDRPEAPGQMARVVTLVAAVGSVGAYAAFRVALRGAVARR